MLILNGEEEFENIKKYSFMDSCVFSHKESKETCRLIDQKVSSINDFEEDENEFMVLFFSVLNKDIFEMKNSTLCGYFQKVFCALMTQIRGEVLSIRFFLKKNMY